MTRRDEWIQRLLFPDKEEEGEYRVRLDENARRSDVPVLSGIEKLINGEALVKQNGTGLSAVYNGAETKVILSVDPLTLTALLIATSVLFILFIMSTKGSL